MSRAWKNLVHLVRGLLRQGMTRRKIALTLVLGLVISIFPVVGIPTLLCTMAALGLRLNLPLIQAVNYLGAPLQWAMIVPFLRLGEYLTGATPLPLSPSQLRAAIESEGIGFFAEFLGAGLHAALGWLAVCPLMIGLLYLAARARFPEHDPAPLRDAARLCHGR